MYKIRQHPSRRHRRLVLWLAFAVIMVVALVGWTLILKSYVAAPSTSSTLSVKSQPSPTAAHSNTLFFGNVYFSRYINDWSMASPLKFSYPFSRLNEFGRENYDAWITGLECPTVAGLQQTSAAEDATLSFNCNPEYLKEARKWFTAVTLANNHTDNQGLTGFAETQEHLKENSIQYFGHPDPRELGDICDVIALPAKIAYSNGSTKEGSLPVAMCGYHGFIRIPSQESVAIMKQYANYMPVIAMPHAGKEYVPAADVLKTELYRSMIDNGADMVIGDHPHWVQNTEAYKGHPIIYSMGNFIFDQQYNAEVTRSAGINVLFEVKNANKTELAKWLAIGKTCASYHDTCLEQVKKAGLKKLPYTFTLSVVGTDDSAHIAKPASAEIQAGILKRMNWLTTITQLAAPYSGK
jgi:poly-gamma-glutamate synthesis protein (capsule biosynthesis protein)